MTQLAIPDVVLIDIDPVIDDRGFFARLLCCNELAENGIVSNIVQCNNTLTHQQGSIRGLHFQRPPKSETKIVRCIRGAVFDVALDVRARSPTFGQHCGSRLTETNRRMMVIPPGFAHGFQTLTNDVELLYFHSEYYSPEHEGGVNPLDSLVGVDWPLEVTEISDRDRSLPQLLDVEPIEL
jgi:dTDP-4-dehydrorhamnose 3,5-epimerase